MRMKGGFNMLIWKTYTKTETYAGIMKSQKHINGYYFLE